MTLLRVEGVTKRYGGTLALDSVDFDVHAGAVNVLIGENGAGKSTLMRILAGVEQPTSGQILLDGSLVSLDSVYEASTLGIGIVHQELNFCPNLTVAENIFLGARAYRKRLTLDRKSELAQARSVLARLEQDIDPETPMGELRIGQQQIVEIAKALFEECRVLILDEPTSALSAVEVDVLFRIIAELKRSGVAIIYISHRLEELLRIGDYITVLRDGRVVDRTVASAASLPWIVDRMLGENGQIERRTSARNAEATTLEVRGLTLTTKSRVALRKVSCGFRAGEITALFGLLGAGRTELLEAICGVRCPQEGSVLLNGVRLDGLSIAERVHKGLLLVPEDRQQEGLFANLSIGANMTLSDLRSFLRWGKISQKQESVAVKQMVARLGIKAPAPQLPIGTLSGGNQQKVLIGRSLMADPAVMVLDEPSRGVDVGARAEIFATIERLAEEGLAVIFSTSDVIEATSIADRVIVMSAGEITADLRASQTDEHELIRAANRGVTPCEGATI
jgi:erythritol transport system ATP-binding protein